MMKTEEPMTAYQFLEYSKNWEHENLGKKMQFMAASKESGKLVMCRWLDPYMELLCIDNTDGFCRMKDFIEAIGNDVKFIPLGVVE